MGSELSWTRGSNRSSGLTDRRTNRYAISTPNYNTLRKDELHREPVERTTGCGRCAARRRRIRDSCETVEGTR